MHFTLHLNVDLGSSCVFMYSVDGVQVKTLTLRPVFILPQACCYMYMLIMAKNVQHYV
jgi:hypothetical protein